MLKYLWDLLFYSCRHKWEIEHKAEIYSGSTGRNTVYCFVQKCEHCGKIKQTKVMA